MMKGENNGSPIAIHPSHTEGRGSIAIAAKDERDNKGTRKRMRTRTICSKGIHPSHIQYGGDMIDHSKRSCKRKRRKKDGVIEIEQDCSLAS